MLSASALPSVATKASPPVVFGHLLEELRVHREAAAHVVRLAEEIGAVLDVDLVVVADLDRVDLARRPWSRGAPRTRARSMPALESPSVSRMIDLRLARRCAGGAPPRRPTASPMAVALPSMTPSVILDDELGRAGGSRASAARARSADLPKTTTPMRSVLRRPMKSRTTSLAVSRRVSRLPLRRAAGCRAGPAGRRRARRASSPRDRSRGRCRCPSRRRVWSRSTRPAAPCASDRAARARRRGARRADRGGACAAPRGPASERRDRADAEARHAPVLPEGAPPPDERHQQRARAGTTGTARSTLEPGVAAREPAGRRARSARARPSVATTREDDARRPRLTTRRLRRRRRDVAASAAARAVGGDGRRARSARRGSSASRQSLVGRARRARTSRDRTRRGSPRSRASSGTGGRTRLSSDASRRWSSRGRSSRLEPSKP